MKRGTLGQHIPRAKRAAYAVATGVASCPLARKAMLAAIAALCVATTALADVAMPRIMSHRGESQDRPENTMAAFRLAFERGVDGVECDVYATTDNVPVIIHDSTTGRTAGSGTNLTVTASSWNDLKDVRVGAFGSWIGTEWEGETIPKLEDYLALLASNETTRCIIELKGNGANSLVANVVAAVQAQPLATADRVVFIAFDSSLISAVRTALPDYEAWLLYSSGTYTGAGLISDIQTYNATGVDVKYNATFSAEDVAAVKAAGYAFAVWTCDSDATAFTLAQKGVDEIATNRGGAMKTNLATMIADYNTDYNNHLEINDARFPSGLTLMDVGAYVQTSLVGHFDGIRNAGADQPHSMTNRTWKNLVSGGPDAPFTGNGGYWTTDGKGFYFDGSSVYARLASPGIDLNHTTSTVQLASDITTSQQSSGSGWYPGLFHSSDSDDFGIYIDNNNTKGTKSSTLIWKAEPYSNKNRPQITSWAGKYATILFTYDTQYLFDSATISNGKSRSARNNKDAKQFSWGGSVQSSTRYMKGTYYSVRIYNAALTDDDLAWNRIVDEVRFRNVVTNGSVFVASNRAGAEGTEASGQYYVNGNHTFTAPATVTIDGCVYTNAGYKLERWNPTGNGWDFVSVVASNSFAYTNCMANTGARITWNWHLKSGVKKIDADDYVQGGLLLGFDGIRNAGVGVAHDDSATIWKNLGSLGGEATPETFDAERPGVWTAKGYRFDGGDCFVTPTVKLGRQATLQVAVDYNESLQTATSQFPSPFGLNVDKDHFNIYTYRKYATDRGDEVRFYSRLTDQLAIFNTWDGRFVNAIGDYCRASATSAASPEWMANHAFSSEVPGGSYCIGTAWKSASSRKARSFSGLINAVRLYDCVLTEAELAHNMEIDNIRFYAGAGRSTETNLVEVACESPGGVVTVDEAGSWIVRGEGASKTFTAPATVTVGNNTYSCAGYRTETWNAAKRMWENPVETASVLSVELSSTEQNRRITWLYALTAGIRSAADYDVCDYVQNGLVANYDGIRNLGPGNGHATAAQRWRDSSYRDVPMIAASNTAHKAWVGFGHHFTAAEENFFEMTEPISLGQTATIQGVLDITPTAQTTSYPLFFGFGYSDYSFFTRTGANRTRLEVKYPNWIGSNLYVTGWEGKYFTSMITSGYHYFIQGTTLGTGTARNKNVGIPEKKFAIGAPNTYTGNDRKIRCMSGDYYALRIYNRALTEAELAHNMTVDEIRYRGNFTNANVTVVCEVPFEGVEPPVSMPAGDYEVFGSFTFTAESLVVGGSAFPPRYTVETWDGSAWGEPEEHDGGSYTYTAGAKVRLTWKWADPTVPVTATWTGLGDASNLLDPANWSCVNAAGETIAAAPTNVTTVVIGGTTAFSIPDGVTTFPWKEIKFGDPDAHVATRCGNYKLSSNVNFTDALAGMFAVMSAANTSLANLNGGGTSWQTSYLKTSRVRYDGWFYVTAAQAGTWTVNQMFDDYFGFAIDGEWIVVNPSYVNSMAVTVDVPEGWHRFTVVCGDTSGGYGATETSSVVVNGVHAPMSISWGGAAVTFTDGNFTFGGEAAGTITLTDDCDWSALGNVFIANGATIDLNGHDLTLASVSADVIGAAITNSNNAVTSTVTFVAGEGVTVTNGGAAICGNIKVVKKGAGTYYAYANACNYSGGTFIDEGTAQPPDGSGTDTQYSYDNFKAFGTSEIYVASGAMFDLRANYAYRSRIVLRGGTLTNTKADMTKTTWGGSGIGRLEAGSTNRVPCSTVFGDNNGTKGGNLDLNGHTLTVLVSSGKTFYLRCGKIENGTMDFANNTGWLEVVNACVATNVDFRMTSALKMSNTLSVRDYEAAWATDTKTHNDGTAALNVYGAFKPTAGQKFYGCTMRDGSTIDLSGQTGAFSTLSYFTKGSTNITFAAGANVTVNLAGREGLPALARAKGLVMTWPAGLAPAADVTFEVDAATKQAGFRVVRDDEANGLRFCRRAGFILIVK